MSYLFFKVLYLFTTSVLVAFFERCFVSSSRMYKEVGMPSENTGCTLLTPHDLTLVIIQSNNDILLIQV